MTTQNTLYYGDNLDILREYIPSGSVDLIYLDPPFNSNRSYNVLFKEESGRASDAQIQAFDDTWHWPGAVETYHELVTVTGGKVGEMIGALHGVLGGNQMMAYLVMMAARLVELHRVLKPTGSIYLHCDPTASHYLKVVMDTIFGAENFINEIVWLRTNPKGQAFTRFASSHDVILRYSKTSTWTWNSQYRPHDPEYVENFYKYIEPETGRRYTLDNLANPNHDRPNLTYEFMGVTRVWRWTKERMQRAYDEGLIIQSKDGTVPRLKRYLDEQEGTPIGDVWNDIPPIGAAATERMGYPTQKPLALLERIINASSNPGDIVLDPFAGCGTAVIAAQKLGRSWIGIDITHLSTSLLKSRLLDSFSLLPKRDYEVVGEPVDLHSAQQLAQEDRYQFQWWAGSLIAARPLGGEAESKKGKKGADGGIDAQINFIDDASNKPKRVIVQIKSGHVNRGMIGELRGTIERTSAAIGIFLTLEPPTAPMVLEAAEAGLYTSPGWNRTYPRIQILTVADLLAGKQPNLPPSNTTFQRANRIRPEGVQPSLLDEA